MSTLLRLRGPRATALFSIVWATALVGCADRACIDKASARAVSGSFCPSRSEASQMFADQCGSLADESITSVDSDPTDEGKVCCYDVTLTTNAAPCAVSARK